MLRNLTILILRSYTNWKLCPVPARGTGRQWPIPAKDMISSSDSLKKSTFKLLNKDKKNLRTSQNIAIELKNNHKMVEHLTGLWTIHAEFQAENSHFTVAKKPKSTVHKRQNIIWRYATDKYPIKIDVPPIIHTCNIVCTWLHDLHKICQWLIDQELIERVALWMQFA